MANRSRARGTKTTDDERQVQGTSTDEGLLSWYMRILEPLAGRSGRQLAPSEWRSLVQSFPDGVRNEPYVQELIARLHRPEAIMLITDLVYGTRLSQIAEAATQDLPSLSEVVERSREILRVLPEQDLRSSAALGERRHVQGLRDAATSALGQVDRLRAALARGSALPASKVESKSMTLFDGARIPELNKRNGKWLRCSSAARSEGLTTETLANYRYQGMKSPDGACGRDPAGRVWRREGNGHAWYLRETLRG